MRSVEYLKSTWLNCLRLQSICGLLMLVFLAGCAGTGGGLGSIEKTRQLSPGMKPGEVRAILGEPASTQLVSEKWVWKYSLHQMFKGFVPYYLVFGRESQQLEHWFADEREYQMQQAQWLKALGTAQPSQSQQNESSQSSDKTECERKYKFREDRNCYCHNVCINW